MRRWLRAVRGAHAERLRGGALNLLARLDRDAIAGLAPRPNPLAEALDAVAAAALAVRARLAPHAPIWAVVAAVTGWQPAGRPRRLINTPIRIFARPESAVTVPITPTGRRRTPRHHDEEDATMTTNPPGMPDSPSAW